MPRTYLSEDEFKQLWSLNPSFDDPLHDYRNTYQLASGIIYTEILTPDGDQVTLDLILDRYKRHLHIKGVLNEGVEPRFQKKENKIKTIYEYLSGSHFNSLDKLPENSRHFYFWGTLTNEEIEIHYKRFLSQCK